MLRPLNQSDLEWVRKERNRPECRMWFRQATLITPLQQQKWYDNNDMITFIVLDDDGDRVGVVSLSHIDNIARKCEFSIMITPEVRGKGYGKKALWELLGHAFNDLNMEQVYSDVFSHNPSLEHYVNWGFQIYGVLPNWYYKDGKYIHSTVISITKDEYNNSLKPTVSEQGRN